MLTDVWYYQRDFCNQNTTPKKFFNSSGNVFIESDFCIIKVDNGTTGRTHALNPANQLLKLVSRKPWQTDPFRKRSTSVSVNLPRTVCSFVCDFIALEIMESELAFHDDDLLLWIPCAVRMHKLRMRSGYQTAICDWTWKKKKEKKKAEA